MRFFRRLRALLGRASAEREMSREMAAHLQLMQDDFERQGMTPAEARVAALRAYGGVEQAREMHRDARSFAGLETLFQDLRQVLRSLAKSPAFTLIALLSLGCGIGVNTSIFTLVNGILLKELPVADPHRIVEPEAVLREFTSDGFSFPGFEELRNQREVFSDVIGFWRTRGVLDLNNNPRKVSFTLVTGSYFRFFDARPALGRLLDEEDDRVERANAVCVLSYRAWQDW